MFIQSTDDEEVIKYLREIREGNWISRNFTSRKIENTILDLFLFIGGIGFFLWFVAKVGVRYYAEAEYTSFQQIQRAAEVLEMLVEFDFWGQIIFFFSIIVIVGLILRKVRMLS